MYCSRGGWCREYTDTTSYHFLSLPLTAYFLSLPITSHHFPSLPITSYYFLLPTVGTSCVFEHPLLVCRRLSSTHTPRHELPPSPAVSCRLPMSTTRLSYTPLHVVYSPTTTEKSAKSSIGKSTSRRARRAPNRRTVSPRTRVRTRVVPAVAVVRNQRADGVYIGPTNRIDFLSIS